MSITITSERVHALIRDLAQQTGQSQAEAVEDAMRRRLRQLQREAEGGHDSAKFSPAETGRRRASIDRILTELHSETTPEQRAALDAPRDSLYDRSGLPA